MLEKYRATIHGNTIEWNDDVPDEMKNNDGVGVYVTLIENRDDSAEPNGKRAVETLQRIADRGGIKSIPDPDKWLREIRKDRPLPGRTK